VSEGRGGAVAVLGLAGALVGALAAGAAAGVAAERFVVRRSRHRGDDPYADEPFDDLPADEVLTVHTSDGVDVRVEIVGPPTSARPEGGLWPRRPKPPPTLTVVFVHGFALDMGTWHFQRKAFAVAPSGDEDGLPPLRMVFYDQPGHGRSTRRPDGEYSIDELAGDLAEIIATVAPEGPLVLVGHSMGGMTLMALAERQSDLVLDRVVGVGLISTSAGHLDDVALGLPPVLAGLRGRLTPAVAKALRWQPLVAERGRAAGSDLVYLLTKRYAFGSDDVSPALVDHVARMNAKTHVEVIAGYLATLSAHDRYAALEAYAEIEALVVCGTKDLLTPVEHTREIAQLLPGATLLEVPDGGHCTVLEHSDAVNEALADLFRRAADAVDKAPRSDKPGRTARRSLGPGTRAEQVSARRQRREKVAGGDAQERRTLRRILRRKGQ
jgi:pimeloyl-ACP methyl ester carboxylesterase